MTSFELRDVGKLSLDLGQGIQDESLESLLHSNDKQRAPKDEEDLITRLVPTEDDPSLTSLSIRVFVLGIILCCIGAAVSQLFYFKSNAPSFSSFFIVLISLPLGRLCARYIPDIYITIGPWSMPLNPGPFTIKEHLLVAILASSGSTAAYAGDIIAVQDLFYHQDLGFVAGILLLLTTQMLGFGLAGLCYKLLVRPTAMIWPATLTQVALFSTLHDKKGGTSDRLRFFYIVFAACFCYQVLPAYFMPGLSSMAILCWINNDSSVMRALGSGYSGFGLGTLSLDWAVIGNISGLYTPFWASVNYFAGLAGMMYVIAPLLYFSNFWDALTFPAPVNAKLYNANKLPFNVSAVIKPDFSLDEVAWAEAQPLLLTPFFAMSYGISFAVLTSTIVTVLLWNRDTIKQAFGSRIEADIHVQILERSYDLVPASWYSVTGLSTVLASIYLVMLYPLQLPVYALLLSIAVAAFFLVPCGIIMATTNTAIGLNVVTEFIAGFMLPGKPIANIVFKCYGYMAMNQALTLLSDLKLGLYMKIPPKHLFLCQSLGTAIGSIVNFTFIRGVIDSKRGYLDGSLSDPTGQWTGRAPGIFFSASVIWGLIGPARFFSGRYSILYAGFAVGAILPIIPWFIYRWNPKLGKRLKLHKINFPIVLHAAVGPPQIPTNIIITGFLSAWLSQYYARRNHSRWFEKYNYVLSSALDAATSVNALSLYLLGMSTYAGHNWLNNAIDTERCKAES